MWLEFPALEMLEGITEIWNRPVENIQGQITSGF